MTENSASSGQLTFQELVSQLSPETYQLLKTAVELGKWADGTKLSKDQLEHCLQAIIVYETEHLPEQQRLGYIDGPAECAKVDSDD